MPKALLARTAIIDEAIGSELSTMIYVARERRQEGAYREYTRDIRRQASLHRPVFPGSFSCCGGGLVHACNNAETVGTQAADAYFISPDIYSAGYIPALTAYCRENAIDAVLSLFDIDLLVLAQNRTAIEETGAKLVLVPPDFVRTCNDKLATAGFISSLGLNTPKTYGSLSAAKNALASGKVDYPIIVKPRWGMASMSVYAAYDGEELDVLSRKAEREVMGSYLRYESGLTPGSILVYQQRMLGEEYGVDPEFPTSHDVTRVP